MELLKLETILAVTMQGYDVLWLDPHVLAAGVAALHSLDVLPAASSTAAAQCCTLYSAEVRS